MLNRFPLALVFPEMLDDFFIIFFGEFNIFRFCHKEFDDDVAHATPSFLCQSFDSRMQLCVYPQVQHALFSCSLTWCHVFSFLVSLLASNGHMVARCVSTVKQKSEFFCFFFAQELFQTRKSCSVKRQRIHFFLDFLFIGANSAFVAPPPQAFSQTVLDSVRNCQGLLDSWATIKEILMVG